MELPTSPTSSLIFGLIEDLKKRLESKKYGEVGIRFVVHASTVTKYEKIDITSTVGQTESEKIIKETLDKIKRGY